MIEDQFPSRKEGTIRVAGPQSLNQGEEMPKIKVDQSSLLVWYPKIKDSGIRTPRTETLIIEDLDSWKYAEGGHLQKHEKAIKAAAGKIGYPLFLRTDCASDKHDFENASFVKDEGELMSHVFTVLEFNYTADLLGLPCKALIFREFIELDWEFKAFWGNLPIARERRYFVKDGRVQCHHPYWPEEAIEQGGVKNLPENWRQLLKKLNTETEDEVKLLTDYSTRVAQAIGGYWSVDFAKSKNGEWVLIDMAVGDESWHPDCEFIQ